MPEFAKYLSFRPARPALRRLAVGLGIALAAGAAPASNLIANGGFEAPPVAPGSYQAVTPEGWAWAGPFGVVFNGPVYFPLDFGYTPEAFEGEQYVDIGNTAAYSLAQTFTVSAAGLYALSWHDASFFSAPTSPYAVSVVDATLQPVFAQALDAAHAAVWVARSYGFALEPGEYTLRFTAQGVPNGYDTRIDAVSLSPVPEPAAAVLLLLGLCGLAGAATRRTAGRAVPIIGPCLPAPRDA